MMRFLPPSVIRPIRAVGALAALVGSAITCMDAPTRAPARRSYVSFITKSSMSATEIAALRVRAFTRARITITTVDGTAIGGDVVEFTSGSGTRDVNVQVLNVNPGTEVRVKVDLLDDAGTIVWNGTPATATTSVSQGGGTPAVVTYQLNPLALIERVQPFASATSFPAAGGPVTISANAYDANAATVQVSSFAWSASPDDVASISSTGVLTPKKAGTVRVTATAGGVSGFVDITFTAAPPFSKLVVTSGSGQTATVGQAATQQFTVQARNTLDEPMSGQVVTFTASTGASITPASVTTGATGNASATMTVGNTPATYTFTATSGTVSQQVTVTAVAGSPSAIAATSATTQTAAAGSAVTFTAKVTDAQGNALAGASVTWTRTSGAGTPATSSTSTSSAGIASLTYTLGTAIGTETVRASVTGVTSTVTFTVTKTAGAAAQMTAPGGTSFTFKANQPIAVQPSVLITDANGNPVEGVVVTADLFSSSGSLILSQNVTSGADGKVTTNLSGLTAQPGSYTVVVKKDGLTGSPITFHITIEP
jgi:hypothetical protein